MNAPVLVISSIIPAVVASAMEAEYATAFMNGQAAVSLRNTCADLGYPQKETPIIIDNSAASSIANRTAKQRKSRCIQMRYHWIRDRVDNGEFKVIWAPGAHNKADFFSKTLPATEFLRKRDLYVHTPISRFSKFLEHKKKAKEQRLPLPK
jgi:hypothetical protein